MLALVGQALVVAGVAAALTSSPHRFLLSTGEAARRVAATTFAGAIGAGLGAVIRNIGGAVTTSVSVLFLIPPLVVQLFSGVGSWIPPSPFVVISGWALLCSPPPPASWQSRDETSWDASPPRRAPPVVGSFGPDRAGGPHLASWAGKCVARPSERRAHHTTHGLPPRWLFWSTT